MNKPTIFIGSSSEGESIAYALQANLENAGDVTVWKQGIFELGSSYLESLIKELDKADFAILVLTEDDITKSRGEDTASPRDNVLFELGLFMGRLGRERSFYVYDKDIDLKIPSDLAGICGAGYRKQESGPLAASLGAACYNIRTSINKAGLRPKTNIEYIQACNKQLEFCKKITGHWWERLNLKPEASSVLSFVTIEYDEESLLLKLKGRSYDRKANNSANWESRSAGIHFDEQRLIYFWEGWLPSTPTDRFEGVGEITFNRSEDEIKDGYGIFSNSNIANIKEAEKRSFEFTRCEEVELDIMSSKDKENMTSLIIKKIGNIS